MMYDIIDYNRIEYFIYNSYHIMSYIAGKIRNVKTVITIVCFGKLESFQDRTLQSDEYEEDKLLKSCRLELVLKGTDIGLVCSGYFGSR